jgi:hypothetical protein
LAPQRGSGYRRDGSPDATVAISGVTAQKLKYLDVLLEERWTVRVGSAQGFPLAEDVRVHVPNPASYLVHKILVLANRKSSKQPKDVLYIHDTLLMFAEAVEPLRVSARLVLGKIGPAWVRTFTERRLAFFKGVDDRIRGAARIALETGRAEPPRPERIRLVCAQGLDRIFG